MDIEQSPNNIHTLWVPNADAMREHVEHLFGGYLDGFHDGLIELGWTSTTPDEDGRYPLRYATLYPTDQIEELVQKAVSLNSTEHCNTYIGAALRKPGTFPGGRASDSDFFALTCLYVDLDDEGATARARDRYNDAKPTKVVVTGKAPYPRAQGWWRLQEPIYDPAQAEAALKGMAQALGGDPTVTNPARVMRLAGSIAWPMKPGRQIEQTYIAPLKEPGQAEYDCNHLARLFPPIAWIEAGGINTGVSRETTPLGMPGKVIDGRDDYLLRTTEAILIELIGETGKCPTGQELYDRVWPQYDRNVDPNKPRKREDYVARKCGYTIRRFLEGKIRGLPDVATAIDSYRRKKAYGENPAKSESILHTPPIDPATGQPTPLIQTGTDFVGAYRPPDYLIDNLIQKGYLYSLTGPTGHGKTPTAMLMGIRVALGRPFHGRPTTQGSVLFLAGENSDDIRARYVALSDHEKFDIATTPFYFIDGVIDIKAEMPRIEAEAAKIPNLSMVIIDTDQAYFLGDEGNSNEQRKWFAKTLRMLLKLPGNPTALVNCHPVKNASQDNLVPLGGSSFLNEVDGNIQCWAEDRVTTIKPHATKWRGTAFESMAFDLKTVTSDRLKDTKGRHIPSVMAVEISEEGAARRGAVLEEDDKSVLRMYYRDKNASLTTVAKALGWLWPNGTPAKSKVQKAVDRLRASKMVYSYHGGKYRITKKGAKHIGEKWGGDDDE